MVRYRLTPMPIPYWTSSSTRAVMLARRSAVTWDRAGRPISGRWVWFVVADIGFGTPFVGADRTVPLALGSCADRGGRSRRGWCVLWGFDGQVRQTAVQPAGQPPVGVAEHVHEGRYQHSAQDERVQRDRGGQSNAELGDVPLAGE